ncbi:lipoate--protein ligase family protein [Leptospira gomenensis]|uniref:Lipoate--protein ligase family protein n=1 Tax=Leptospira gomenensis TaxID=2484974 RepID=A0A5F1YU56_9LEPT|nr:lipoate--protein ligase family protein [Leptospira gomenensis]TGK31766.1 lipoate--protein ligase family protein [Leptospira gomenensis]TGK41606.1 lipoate--protein ligase family protein [Leptospira gomenensis]TGK61434.1 lipoate--protein ligase family protein [Leptospira gomenensis]
MRTFLFTQNSERSSAYNLAIEESIGINLVSSGYGAGLRIWKNPFSIVLGLSEKAEDTILPEIIRGNETSYFSIDHDEKIANRFTGKPASKRGEEKNFNREFPEIVRRASGGGTVVHHPEENLNFTFFVSLDVKPELYKVKESYEYFLDLVKRALAKQTLDAMFRGKSDLAVIETGLEKKISGNAQFRKKGAVVHHGTLILKPSLIKRVAGLLKHPPEEPEYRKNRNHSDFVTSLPADFSPAKFGQDLSHVFAESLGLSRMDTERDLRFSKTVLREAQRLFTEKYSRMDFIFRD